MKRIFHIYCIMNKPFLITEPKIPIFCQIEDVYKGVYNGISSPKNTEGNQCGLVINRATIEDQGTWICKIYIKGTILLGSKIVNLAGNDSNIY